MKRKIKILFAINCMNIGGAPSVVFNQMKFLDHKQFEPYLLTLYPSKQANFLAQMDFLDRAHQVHFQLKNRSMFDWRTLLEIYRYLRKEQFDVIYTHLFLANFIVRTLGILARVPIILVFEHSTYFNKSRWQIVVDRLLALFTDKIIVSTEEVAKFTSMQEWIPRKQFMAVRNPVDIPIKNELILEELWSMAKCKKGSPLFLTLGRFSEEKGQKILLAAAREVHKNFPGVQFLIIGHGPEENALKAYVEKYEMDAYCHILHEPLRAREFLYLADWFILPSLREGQSIVVEEAMLAGLPIIASQLYGMGEIIENGVNGFTVKPGDIHALAGCIDAVLHKPEQWQQMGNQSRARAELLFSTSARMQCFQELLLQLGIKKGILTR